MADEKRRDDKVVASPGRTRLATLKMSGTSPAPLKEIEHFFERYKDLELDKHTETRGFGNRTQAQEILQEARTRLSAKRNA